MSTITDHTDELERLTVELRESNYEVAELKQLLDEANQSIQAKDENINEVRRLLEAVNLKK